MYVHVLCVCVCVCLCSNLLYIYIWNRQNSNFFCSFLLYNELIKPLTYLLWGWQILPQIWYHPLSSLADRLSPIHHHPQAQPHGSSLHHLQPLNWEVSARHYDYSGRYHCHTALFLPNQHLIPFPTITTIYHKLPFNGTSLNGRKEKALRLLSNKSKTSKSTWLLRYISNR